MSRTLFHSRAILSATALVAALLGTACTDSTGPSTEREASTGAPATQLPNAPATADGDTAAAPRDTSAFHKISAAPTASLVQTNAWAKPPVSRPGYVSVKSRSTVCISSGLLGRAITVQGVKVTNLDWRNGQALSPQRVYVRTLLWRWNPTSKAWQYVALRAWMSPSQQNVFMENWMSVPMASFTLGQGGYYTVTVETYWYAWNLPMAGRDYSLNSATDYAIFGDSQVQNGYCNVL